MSSIKTLLHYYYSILKTEKMKNFNDRLYNIKLYNDAFEVGKLIFKNIGVIISGYWSSTGRELGFYYLERHKMRFKLS